MSSKNRSIKKVKYMGRIDASGSLYRSMEPASLHVLCSLTWLAQHRSPSLMYSGTKTNHQCMAEEEDSECNLDLQSETSATYLANSFLKHSSIFADWSGPGIQVFLQIGQDPGCVITERLNLTNSGILQAYTDSVAKAQVHYYE